MPDKLILLVVWIVLLLLLGAGIEASRLGLGSWQAAVVLLLAAISAGLIAWFDMHLKYSSGILRLFAAGVLIFLLIMFGLGLPDWLTR